MDVDLGITNKVIMCGLCGLLMAMTLNGYVCANPGCPEYMCEKHEHLPEKGDTGTSYIYTPTISVSGTPASATTSTTIYPYLSDLGKGDEI